jgi:sigma-E factor negative regulatory protein RseB
MTRPSLPRPRARAVALALTGLCIGPLSGHATEAQTASAPTSASATTATAPVDMSTLIRRIQESTRQRNFTGTFVISSGSHLSSSRILHICDGKDQIERIEALDGQMRRVFRHNDAIHVFWPGSKTALVEQRDFIGRFPSPLQPGEAARLDMYELQAGGDDRIAGHEAQVVTLRPRDGWRYARRLWVERRTGLLLRSDLLNERGDIIESSAFSELQIGPRLQAQPVLQEMNRFEGYRVSRPTYVLSDLASEGWALRQPIAGFDVQRVVRRPTGFGPQRTTTSSAASAESAPPPADSAMLQAIYSDGLSHVSVFIEPYVASQHRRDTPATLGSMTAVSRRLGDWWITAVGAVPLATLQQFTGNLERRKP